MAPAQTRPRASRRGCVDVASFLEALDSAMFAWAMRASEHPQLVERRLDSLHDAWASMRRTSGDAFERLAASAAVGAATPHTKLSPAHEHEHRARQPVADVRRTKWARKRKAENDSRRERYIVKHYHMAIADGRSPKAAREFVAARIRRGLHLTASARGARHGRGPGDSYSEKSVARVLRRFASS